MTFSFLILFIHYLEEKFNYLRKLLVPEVYIFGCIKREKPTGANVLVNISKFNNFYNIA